MTEVLTILQSREFLCALEHAQLKAASPWRDRDGAAAHCCCSVSEIDRAADEGVIPRHHRGRTPLFRVDELDDVIFRGAWRPREEKESA